MNTPESTSTRKVVLSLGLGTGLLFASLGAFMLAALVAITALHFMPTSKATLKDRVFPRLHSTTPADNRGALDDPFADPVQSFGPVNRDALVEPKAALIRIGGPPPPLPAPTFDDGDALNETKGQQSSCPTCPNYRPPTSTRPSFYEVPRNPSPPSYPSSYPSSYLAPAPVVSPGGSWIRGPRGVVWLPTGHAYEHESGLIRNLQTGRRAVPITPATATTRPPALDPYRRPKLPEQPPLGDDGYGRISPAIPDFTKSPRGELKTGGYACANCKRATVGDQWATQWTDEGTPISFVCKECWERMSPAERQSAYVNWYRRATE